MVIAPPPPPAAIVSSNGCINSSQDFEKWMRMATDNKINTNNSWDLALIDYFYDLSLLRDGDGINFQRASATLDGCVKIYSSRIDSAVTETGRLINGLAASRSTGARIDDDDDDDLATGKNCNIDSETGTKGKRKNIKSEHSTLVEFEAIKVKKMDIELYVDPIFKKVLTDFDEGGSKSLLLNMLHTNQDQRIEFDTTDTGVPTLLVKQDVDSMSDIENSFAGMDIDDPQEPHDIATIDSEHPKLIDEAVMSLGQKYFGNGKLVSSTLCPSLSELSSIVKDNTSSADLIKNLENVEINQDRYENQDFSYGGEGGGGDEFDTGSSDDNHQNESKYPGNKSSIFFDDLEEDSNDFGMTMRMLFNDDKTFEHKDNNILGEETSTQILNIPDENLLAYFDENQRNQWAGPDHWKILKLKRIFGAVNTSPCENSVDNIITKMKPRKRVQREQFRIDFLSNDFPDDELLFTTSKSTTLLPRTQWISKTKNVLPEDKHYSTKNFINLFLKEKLINSIFNKVENVDQPINESLYAFNCSLTKDPETEGDRTFNADFFHNYDDDADNFEIDSPQQSLNSELKIKLHSSQSPLNFERVAKKIDIKLLKDNIWDSLKKEKANRQSLAHLPKIDGTTDSLRFSEVVHGLNSRYEREEKNELSTSFCFICLLHLANENGFSISNTTDHNDLVIQGL